MVPEDTGIVAFAAASVTDPRKGMKQLVEVLGILKQEHFLLTWGRNVPVVGEELAHLHLGNLESDHLAALAYNAADMFVMPPLEEAFGQTALEAVACGVPVVAFNVGGIPDTVKPGLNGYLVPRGDSHALAAGIDKALNDRVMAARWRRRATDWTEENFSYTENARSYIKLYHQLLDQLIQ
ncbi:glycosyltransferase [Synechococcus sp. BSF8S]|uniref:glycosyltransferase n=1 Tax=Synechococcus sp. BSF8S TaxID=2599078 RepID=UPI001C89DD57